MCRASCHQYVTIMWEKLSDDMKKVTKQLKFKPKKCLFDDLYLQLYRDCGGSQDHIVDPFGYVHHLCDTSYGYTRNNRRLLLESHYR